MPLLLELISAVVQERTGNACRRRTKSSGGTGRQKMYREGQQRRGTVAETTRLSLDAQR